MRPLLPRVREVKHHAVEQDALLSFSFSFSATSVPAAPQQGFLEPGGVHRVDDLTPAIRFAPPTNRDRECMSGRTKTSSVRSRSAVGSVSRDNMPTPQKHGWSLVEIPAYFYF